MDDIRKGTCPLCSHNEILERRSKPTGFRETRTPHPVAEFLPAEINAVAYGARQRCICLRCGFVQEFELSPDTLPRTHDDHVIKGPAPAGPYR